MPRSYSHEYRRRVIGLLESDRTVTEVAEGLEVTAQTIYNRWNQHLIDTGQKPGVTTTDDTELVAARKRIAELEAELTATRRANELLKEVVPPRGRRWATPRRCPGRRDRRDGWSEGRLH